MVLLVCCYLYRKRSNIINVNAEAKEQGRDVQTPIDDSSIFTEVSRSGSGNSVDSFSPSLRASGSPTCLPACLSWMLPAVFTIKLPAETPWALFPPVHSGGHTTNTVGVISQDFKPSDVQHLCSQARGGKRYANLTKH